MKRTVKVLLLCSFVFCGMTIVSASEREVATEEVERGNTPESTNITLMNVDFPIPDYYENVTETESSLTYCVENNKLIELSFRTGDYNGDDIIEEVKRSISETLVSKNEDIELENVCDSDLDTFPGVRFEFSSDMHDMEYISYGGYYYDEMSGKYVLIAISVPKDISETLYIDDFSNMITSSEIDRDYLSEYLEFERQNDEAQDTESSGNEESSASDWETTGSEDSYVDDWYDPEDGWEDW